MLKDEAVERVIVALDCDREDALRFADELLGSARWLKVGMTLYYAEGPAIVQELVDRGFKVFLDLKFHDIPHQVRGAARSAALAGAHLLSVHGLGGQQMLQAAAEGVCEAATTSGERAQLVAITVLTSMDGDALQQIGVSKPLAEEVESLACLAQQSRIDGVVCSPREAQKMRELLGPKALIVTPGVRPQGAESGDQSRIATPAQALQAGASHIVVGRPITAAAHPRAAFEAIIQEICDQVD